MTLTDGEKHDLSKHDAVTFEAAEGTEGEETCLAEDSFPVRRVVTPTSFTIPRTPALGGAFKGGRFRQVRRPFQDDVCMFTDIHRPRLIQSIIHFKKR